ncbi:CapA family protein [uncultured Shewanella sp.]|uniref:CapA family protein n=1 Tax=uncultured Shewanella sp. TaxID=173975 RepID=UPI00261EA6D3|nr:CapA family protein [uncultured Shewanella sp.]
MKIAFIGDIAFFGRFCIHQNPKALESFQEVKKAMDGCDYVVGNLETPLVENGVKLGSKSAYISGHPDNIKILEYLGINAVNLSNNHIFDFGEEGYKSTTNILDKSGIDWFGCEDKIHYLNHPSGENIAFHGYCSLNTNPIGYDESGSKPSINHLSFHDVINNFSKIKDAGYFNVMSIHSGFEHINIPSRDDIDFARYLSTIDDYFYFGHHPHVLQGIEKINNSIIAYSLGNFCFDDIYDERTENPLVKQSVNNKESAICILDIQGGEIVEHKTIDFFIGDNELKVVDSGKMSEYSNMLSFDMNCYSEERTRQIEGVIKKRNSSRDFKWFISRFRLSTFFRILESYLNKNRYSRLFYKPLMKTIHNEQKRKH